MPTGQPSGQPTSQPQKQSVAPTVTYIPPPGCDAIAAQKCEDAFLNCQLYNGPANDPKTICDCSTIYYGSCLSAAGKLGSE
jgi:hypothetical protein